MLSVSSIRTIPSASEFHRISGGAKGAAGRGLYRRWGIAPRPETDFLSPSIAQVLKNASGYGIIAANAVWHNSRKRGYYTFLRNGSPFWLRQPGNRLWMRNYTIPLRFMV